MTISSKPQVRAVNNKQIAMYQLDAGYYVNTVSTEPNTQTAVGKNLLSS
jgi:hypothetical protein